MSKWLLELWNTSYLVLFSALLRDLLFLVRSFAYVSGLVAFLVPVVSAVICYIL